MEIRSPPHWMMPRAWCGGRGVSRPRGPDRALLAYRAGAPSLPGLVLCGQLWGERCWGEEGSRCPPSGEDGSLRHRQQVRVLSRKVRKLCRRGDSLLLRGERSGKIGRRRGAGTRSGAAGPDCSTPCPPRTCGSQRGRLARSLPGLPCLSPSPRPSPASPPPPCGGVLAPDRGLVCLEQNHLCLVHCHTLPPCHPAPDAGMRASTPAMLRGRVRHATILLRGPVSHPRAECSVFHTDGDNAPGNRSEGRSSRSLQSLPPNPPGEAASRWPGSVFVTTGTFLWIPRKSIFLSSKH